MFLESVCESVLIALMPDTELISNSHLCVYTKNCFSNGIDATNKLCTTEMQLAVFLLVFMLHGYKMVLELPIAVATIFSIAHANAWMHTQAQQNTQQHTEARNKYETLYINIQCYANKTHTRKSVLKTNKSTKQTYKRIHNTHKSTE